MPETSSPRHRCEECDKEFQTQDALNDHNFGKHNIKKPKRDKADDSYMTEADYQTWYRL